MLEHHLDMTIREWIEYHQEHVVLTELSYRGVTILKNVLDLWIYQEIIHRTRPEVVVEIGAKHGGSAMWFSDALPNGTVVSIDLKRPLITLPDNVVFVGGDSVAAATVEAVFELCDGHSTMVVADGDHRAEHVLEELRLYSPLVPVGGYFVVEDGIVDVMRWEAFCPGPAVAVRRFLAETDEFVVDEACEKFILTYNPGSYLRRQRRPD